MKKFTLSKIIDFIFKNTLMFFIAFVWIRFYVNDLYLTLFLSVMVTVLFGLFLTLKQQKKYANNKITAKENALVNSITNEFLFNSHKHNLNFFLSLASKKYNTKIINDFILIENNGFKIVMFPFYKNRKLDIDEATNIYIKAKSLEAHKLIITCKNTDQEVLNFTKQLKSTKIIVLNSKQTYLKLLKKYNVYPKIENKLIEEEKITLRQIFVLAFNKKKTKSYVFSGLILFLASFIIRYNLYYIIFSSLLFLMALFSYFNVPFNKKLPENILDE